MIESALRLRVARGHPGAINAASPDNMQERAHLVVALERISINVIRQCHLLVPVGPRATRKRIAGSITSGYLGKRARSELDLYVLQPSLSSGIATHDSDYPCPLPRQRSERSYRSRRPATRATYM